MWWRVYGDLESAVASADEIDWAIRLVDGSLYFAAGLRCNGRSSNTENGILRAFVWIAPLTNFATLRRPFVIYMFSRLKFLTGLIPLHTGAEGGRHSAWEVVSKLPNWHRESVNHNAADGKEPDDNSHNLLQMPRILSYSSRRSTIHGDGVQKVDANVKVEDCRDADRAKEADKRCLLKVFDLRNVLVHAQHDRHSSE